MITNLFLQSSLQQSLQGVPQEIRHWFGSERVTYLIMDINKKLGLRGEDVRIIPRLLLRLEVHDLRPQYFIQELSSQLKISNSAAKTLALEIEEKILEPIKQQLLIWEIDINLIKASHLVQQEKEEIKEMTKGGFPPPKAVGLEDTVDLRTMRKLIDDQRPTIDDKQPKIEKESEKPEVQPFIIHKEEGVGSVVGAKRSFGGLFGMFSGKEKKQEAVRAKIEIGGEKEEKLKEKETVSSQPKMKVVHYSDFKTPVGEPIVGKQPILKDVPLPPSPVFTPVPPAPIPSKTALDIPEIKPPVESPAQAAAHVFEKIDMRQESPVPVPPKPEIKQKSEQEYKPAQGEDIIDLRTMKKV